MNNPEYERMFRNEDHYWWFVSRRELVLDAVGRLPLSDTPTIVDIGCGTGATADALRRFGKVVGVDFSSLALSLCKRRDLNSVVQGRAEALPLPDACADVLVATDILEHLDDDLAALAEFLRVLKPGGHAVITVPAFRFLWSEHDDALMHRRRYVAPELATRARSSGFRIAREGYALFFLFPLALGRLLKPKAPTGRPPEAQLKPVAPWLNAALIRFQRFESALSRTVRLPWGLSVVAVLQKPTLQQDTDGLDLSGTQGGRFKAHAAPPSPIVKPARTPQAGSRLIATRRADRH